MTHQIWIALFFLASCGASEGPSGLTDNQDGKDKTPYTPASGDTFVDVHKNLRLTFKDKNHLVKEEKSFDLITDSEWSYTYDGKILKTRDNTGRSQNYKLETYIYSNADHKEEVRIDFVDEPRQYRNTYSLETLHRPSKNCGTFSDDILFVVRDEGTTLELRKNGFAEHRFSSNPVQVSTGTYHYCKFNDSAQKDYISSKLTMPNSVEDYEPQVQIYYPKVENGKVILMKRKDGYIYDVR